MPEPSIRLKEEAVLAILVCSLPQGKLRKEAEILWVVCRLILPWITISQLQEDWHMFLLLSIYMYGIQQFAEIWQD
jgi:hypothetical protein